MKRREAEWARFGFLAVLLIACSSSPDDTGGDDSGGNAGGTGAVAGSGAAGSSAGTSSTGAGGSGGSGTSGGGSSATGGNEGGASGSASSTGGGSGSGGTSSGAAGGNSGGGGSGGASSGGASAGSSGAGGTSAGGGGNAGSASGGSAGAAGSAGGSGGAPNPGNLKATIVVRGAGTATAGDNVMIGRIKAHGFSQVTVVSDAAVTAPSVVGSDLVVISSSAESGPLKAKLKDITIPVLCVEDAEFSLMGMATEGDHDAGVSTVVIVAASPLVGSATGTVTFSSKVGELGWGVVATSAVRGATVPGNTAHAAIFGYEKGAQMVGMTAPARRAGFAIRETLAVNLNAEGLALFDSLLDWVMK